MKKILLLIASAAIALAVNAAPQKVDFGKLPKNSQEFIQKNFPGEKVKAVEMDRRRGTNTPSISTAATRSPSKAAAEIAARLS